MLPAYYCSSWAALFFVEYLMVGLFFIVNLILAVAYSTFQDNAKTTTMHSVRALQCGGQRP